MNRTRSKRHPHKIHNPNNNNYNNTIQHFMVYRIIMQIINLKSKSQNYKTPRTKKSKICFSQLINFD